MKYTDDRQNLDFPNLCFVGPYLKIEAQIFVLNMFALHCAKLIILYIKIITVFSAFAKYLFLEFCHFINIYFRSIYAHSCLYLPYR